MDGLKPEPGNKPLWFSIVMGDKRFFIFFGIFSKI
jgi:hypothetical protein